MSFYISVDLGQAQDYTAVSVLETVNEQYLVRHLQRFALGTPYPSIVTEITSLTKRLPGGILICDQTGVGAPVTDMFRVAGVSPIAVSITGGDTAKFTEAPNAIDPARKLENRTHWSVPKRDLVSALSVALQSGKLRIAASLPDGDVLIRELTAFRVKISDSGHDSYAAWRERDHDDLVLSIAMGVYVAGKFSGKQVPIGYASGVGMHTYDNRTRGRHLATVWAQPDTEPQERGLPGLGLW